MALREWVKKKNTWKEKDCHRRLKRQQPCETVLMSLKSQTPAKKWKKKERRNWVFLFSRIPVFSGKCNWFLWLQRQWVLQNADTWDAGHETWMQNHVSFLKLKVEHFCWSHEKVPWTFCYLLAKHHHVWLRRPPNKPVVTPCSFKGFCFASTQCPLPAWNHLNIFVFLLQV